MAGSSTCDIEGVPVAQVQYIGDVPVGQGPVLWYWGCTGRTGSSACYIRDIPEGQGPVRVI